MQVNKELKLSKNFKVKEALKSQRATELSLSNNFDKPEHLLSACQLSIQVLQKIRDHFGAAVIISSWYRSPSVNKAVGGAKNSQHTKGSAADIDRVSGWELRSVFNYIKDNLDFDQLIWESGNDDNPDWIHVSYNEEGNRREVLRASKQNGKTVYTKI